MSQKALREANRGNERPSEAIREANLEAHQRPSEAIRGHQRGH